MSMFDTFCDVLALYLPLLWCRAACTNALFATAPQIRALGRRTSRGGKAFRQLWCRVPILFLTLIAGNWVRQAVSTTAKVKGPGVRPCRAH